VHPPQHTSDQHRKLQTYEGYPDDRPAAGLNGTTSQYF